MVGRRPIAAPEVLVENEGQLASAVKKLASQGELLLQHRPPGHIYKALIGDRRLLCVLQMGGENQPLIEVTDQCPSSFLAHIDQLKRAVNSGLMCLSFVSEDISRSPFFFLDVDVAPRLDQFLTIDSPHLRSAADALLHWLFPAGVESRIPIIAITGTNGKTTTTNMVHWTLRSDGRRPGMANSDGLFDGERQAFYEGDSAGFSGHAMLLGDPRFDSLALETAHGGIANGGFAFDFCDVAVCVNVTRDHLFSLGIESVQDMAALKRSLLARARQGVVVNADNSMTLKMLPFPKAARTCLVSTGKSLVELEAIPGAADLFAVVEGKDAKAEVVIYDSGQRMPVLPVNSLPVALGGIARYNLSNALHAAAACYLVGVKVVTIADSLASFHPNAEQNPGRFNIYDNLPFTVILDYAHNPDGLAQLASTIDRYKIPGRKIITVSAAAYQDDRTVCENARMVAGHFDHYYCFNYAGDVGRGKSHIATLVAEELHKIGVKEEKISIVDTEMEATRQALASADEHDLVVLLPGRTRRAEVLEMVTAQRSKQSTA
jgi:cyanophycin synthetase